MKKYLCIFFLSVSSFFLGGSFCLADSSYKISSFVPQDLLVPQKAVIDTSQFTPETVRKKMESAEKVLPGKVVLKAVKGLVEMRTLYSGDGLFLMGMQQGDLPETIYLEKGRVTLEQIHAAFPQLLLKEAKDHYLSKRPIVVGRNATLSVENSTLKLSEERGAFLVNAGKMFFVDSELTGWRESTNGPAFYSGDKKKFRPFFVSWGGSESYFCNVTASHLGYLHTKSFGITFSTYLVKKDEKMFQDRNFDFSQPPHGWIINSTFKDIFYGFYCYEAKDLVIYNNIYQDNIIYGIDPHDRSTGLIIANNRVSGTKVKHGIIMSRDVTHSYIIGNQSYDNKISGIMLDRNCTQNEISNNIIYKNGEDGVSFYESGKNLLSDNMVIANNAHGIRLRNSMNVTLVDNVVLNNKKFGIYLHTRELSDKTRNLQFDPYSRAVSATLIGGAVGYNLSGSLFLKDYEQFTLYNVLIENRNNRKLRLGGDLKNYADQVIDALSGNTTGLLLTRY